MSVSFYNYVGRGVIVHEDNICCDIDELSEDLEDYVVRLNEYVDNPFVFIGEIYDSISEDNIYVNIEDIDIDSTLLDDELLYMINDLLLSPIEKQDIYTMCFMCIW